MDRSETFFQAAERLFLPRVYQRLRQNYVRLHTTKLRRMHAEPGSAAAIEAEWLAARKRLDRETVRRAKRAWNVKFLKAQIGFGSTWVQRTGVTTNLNDRFMNR